MLILRWDDSNSAVRWFRNIFCKYLRISIFFDVIMMWNVSVSTALNWLIGLQSHPSWTSELQVAYCTRRLGKDGKDAIVDHCSNHPIQDLAWVDARASSSSAKTSSSSDAAVRWAYSHVIIKPIYGCKVLLFNVSGLYNIKHTQALICLTISPTDFEQVIAESNHLVKNCYQSRYALSSLFLIIWGWFL